MSNETTRDKYESELEGLLPDEDELAITEESQEIVEKSEQVSSEVDEYIYKSQNESSKKQLTNRSDS
jgi:hypothetical protein